MRPQTEREMLAEQPRILIALDGRGPAPCGRVQVAGEPERTFSGWLGLLAVLGDAVDACTLGEGSKRRSNR